MKNKVLKLCFFVKLHYSTLYNEFHDIHSSGYSLFPSDNNNYKFKVNFVIEYCILSRVITKLVLKNYIQEKKIQL